MDLGVCYYPEHWPQESWADDAKKMRDLGLTWVRIGEFSWSKIEPKEGVFDWQWLDDAFGTLSDAGLRIVLGTPSATPPRWVLSKYPDMLALDQEGRARKFGSRRHYCFSHLGYRAEAARIARDMAKRYGDKEALKAWQIDNEFGCHDTTLSYSEAARKGFCDWLSQKYQSPQALNRAWGLSFWSMAYQDFDEIDLPNLTVTQAAPAHWMDFRRYSSDQVLAFCDAQRAAIGANSQADICHNYMGRITDFDHFEMGRELDFASWDSYPLGFLEDRVNATEEWKHRFAAQGDPDFQAFHHDLYRRVGGGRFWVMEQQPGPVNWAPYNPAPHQGMVKLWTLEAAAHGAETLCYFRWRQVPYGQEQMHAGLHRPNGEEAEACEEIRQYVKDARAIGDMTPARAKVAILFDYPSQWAWEIERQGHDFDYFALIFDFYCALRRLALNIDFISARDKIEDTYALIFVPGVFSLTDTQVKKLSDAPATVIFGPRCNAKTPDFEITAPLPPKLNLDVTLKYVESLRPGVEIPLEEGGHVIRWIESLESPTLAPVLSTLDGRIIAVKDGVNHYLGAWLDETAAIIYLSQLCDELGIKTEQLPQGIRTRELETGRIIFNYDSAPSWLGERSLPAASFVFDAKPEP